MSTIYITKDGDVADWVAWKHYGSLTDRQLEQVLDANPGLADRGPVLPGGVEIVLPDLTPPAIKSGVSLWD